MPRVFSDADFAEQPKRVFSDADFVEPPARQLSLADAGREAIGFAANQVMSPQSREAVRGLFLRPSTGEGGMVGTALHKAAELGPVAAAGTIGEAAGPAVSGLLAGGARTAQLGLSRLADKYQGIPSPSLGEDVADVAATAAINAAVPFGVGVGKSALKTEIGQAAVGAVKNVGSKLYDYLATSKIVGGIAEPAWNWFKGNVDRTLKYVGKGAEAGDEIANNLRTEISNSSQALEEAYKAGITKLEQGKTGKVRMNVDDAIGDKLRYIAREDAGYMDPARNAASEEAGFYFKNILNRANEMKNASVREIFNFQRDLNGYIADAYAKGNQSLAKNLMSAKTVIREFIENHPKLESIAEMNAAWHDAKMIDQTAKTFTKSNDLIDYVKRTFSNPQDTLKKRGLERVGALVPGVGEELANAQSYSAAQAVSPLFRGLPATGYGAGVGAAGVLAAQTAWSNPMALLGAPLAGALSPRAYALGYKYGPQALRKAGQAAGTVGSPAARMSLQDYYQRPIP